MPKPSAISAWPAVADTPRVSFATANFPDKTVAVAAAEIKAAQTKAAANADIEREARREPKRRRSERGTCNFIEAWEFGLAR